MRLLLFVFCLLCGLGGGLWAGLGASPAWAGAWPRGKGHWFSATSSSWTWPGAGGANYGYSSSFYAEYGLTDTLTLGLDGTVGQDGSITALFFTRVPLWSGSGGGRLALEIASGTSAGLPVFRPGLSWGRGFQSRLGPGWMALDGKAAINLTTGLTAYKLDATLGFSPTERRKTILQIQSEFAPNGAHTLHLAPSVVLKLGQRLHLETGLSQGLLGARQTGLKLGVWLDF